MKETYWVRVGDRVVDHLTDAFLIGGAVVFYGSFFYRPLTVVWAVANVLLAVVGTGGVFVAIGIRLFSRGGYPRCRPISDPKLHRMCKHHR
jgi:hypothetical protein